MVVELRDALVTNTAVLAAGGPGDHTRPAVPGLSVQEIVVRIQRQVLLHVVGGDGPGVGGAGNDEGAEAQDGAEGRRDGVDGVRGDPGEDVSVPDPHRDPRQQYTKQKV